MATAKQRTGSVRPWTITAQNVADFKRGMELRGDEAQREEYLAINSRLSLSLGCLLWIDDILRIDEWRPPADGHDLPEYERSYAIRQALEEASGIRKPLGAAGRPAERPKGN